MPTTCDSYCEEKLLECEDRIRALQEGGNTNCDTCTRNDVEQLQATVGAVSNSLGLYQSCANTATQTDALNNAIAAMNQLKAEVASAKFEAWNDAVGEGGLDCKYLPQSVCENALVTNCNFVENTGCAAA